MATQHTPNRAQASNPQPKPQFYCEPCRKSFSSKTARRQHLRDSPAHKQSQKATPQTSINQAQNPSQKSDVLATAEQQPSHVDRIGIKTAKRTDSEDIRIDDTVAKGPWLTNNEAQTSSLHRALSRHCHSANDLSRNRYELSTYTAEDIDGLRKCKKCGRLAKTSRNTECYFHPGKAVPATKNTPHHFKCCNTSTKGCTTGPHLYKQAQAANKYKELALSPITSPKKPKLKALILDCEMASNIHRQREVIFLCAVDYSTGEVLINTLVQPTLPIHDWNTAIHGITETAMRKAASRRAALSGWKQARAQLWQLIDRDTILVGHALQHDLDVLRMVHTRVVDSAILARNAVGMYSVQWGLQRLCRDLLKLEIRENEGGGA